MPTTRAPPAPSPITTLLSTPTFRLLATTHPIIDTHVHIYSHAALGALRWAAALPTGHHLKQGHELAGYGAAVGAAGRGAVGFVYVETDRRGAVAPGQGLEGWAEVLREVEYVVEVEVAGAGAAGASLPVCRGVVAWAPLPGGAALMAEYFAVVGGRLGGRFPLVKGVRYLTQDKPAGTMLESGFVDGVRWCAENGLVVDLGVDGHRGNGTATGEQAYRDGERQLRECVEFVKMVREGVKEGEEGKLVFDHLLKPPPVHTPDGTTHNPSFALWTSTIKTLAAYPSIYLKLSGLLSELSPSIASGPPSLIYASCQETLNTALDAFGPARCMWGSDWPMCEVQGGERKGLKEERGEGGGEEEGGVEEEMGAWEKWRRVVEMLLDERKCSDEEKEMIWSGTAREVYGLGS